ncbi:hypothetical protein AAZX31_12G050900 [Glycine max]|uniref:Uncharacterized protein n=2 Tax=Glycine subgen. Soja TaxID=1462606 RepID=A0A445HLD8_GLYSO|nr:uncharacterized protein LOC114380200 isoform X1 [Glycine soja]XP_028194971.1 uncharacterized protein LOC114380200 isoform X1 [Glycine soja]RZB74414.1 hypothetical protein D0Y65_033438 [Glycine soja]
MAPSDVCLSEDAVQVFIEHLVDPLLPAKASVQDNPTPSQQKLVANQVRSTVLLYNYYHRKQHPELAYLPFNEFCKLAVVLRPPLLAYMQFMQNLNEEELTDVEKQLSLTEKMIMEACDVCKCLDASKDAPNIEGWPITKVSMLLIDSKKENCFLLFSSITSGVWSVIEKGLDTSSQSSLVEKGLNTSSQSSLVEKGLSTSYQSSEVTSGSKQYKKRRVIKKSAQKELKVDEDVFLQVGYSAVKEATGINNTDIMLLESGTVYSESKEKAASRFYIMQCYRTINEEVIQIPLQVLIKSLQGPLVSKSSRSWMITSVIDYFHVLPYSEIISKWISRGAFSTSLQDSRVTEKNIKVNTPEATDFYVNKDTFTALDSKPNSDNIDLPKQKEHHGSCTPALSYYINEPIEMDVNENSIFKSQNKEKCQYIIGNTVQVGVDQEKNYLSLKYNSNAYASAVKALKVDSTRMLIAEGGVNNLASLHNNYANGPNTSSEKGILVNYTPTANHSNSDLEKLQILSDSKKILSQTALAALIRKRNELALQQRKIEDEIAVCDKKIQRMLTDGEDNFKLKIESIIEGCNGTWVRNQERTSEQQSLPFERKKLSEAVFLTQSPFQVDSKPM